MTRRILSFICTAALLLTPALAYGAGTGEASYLNETELAQGFTYENAVSYDSDGRTETHTLELSPNSRVYPIALACDTIYGGLTASSMISYAESLGYSVVGAINADFGESTGVPTGMVVEDGIYKSSPEGNSALAYDGGRAFVSEKPSVTLRLRGADGFSAEISRFNKSRASSGLSLYSEYFSTVSTRTSGEGWFVRFAVSGGEDIRLGGELTLTVTEKTSNAGAVTIGENNLVLTAPATASLGSVYDSLEIGDTLTLSAECSDSRLEDADWVCGCGNILVKDGGIYEPETWNEAVSGRHPRTLVGIKSDGTALYQVLDGRGAHSVGATMEEAARDLMSRGCTHVVNLDGGGSSIMKLRVPGKSGFTTVNEPSDGRERAVSSFILFVTDAEGSGASRLFLADDGMYVLAGSTVELDFSATDAALRSSSVPEGVSATAQRGSISGRSYTAPATAGTDTISLSGGGISGRGTIHVISRVDGISVTDAATGSSFTRILLDNGESLGLKVTATYLMREVELGSGAVTYSLTGELGTVSADGVLSARPDGSGSGEVNISCGGISVSLPVQVNFEFSDMRGHWASANVKRLYAAGIVNGITASEFGPGLSMKRGDFVVMLWRAAGMPEVTGSSGFDDVTGSEYFASAVAWAAAEGIASGRGDGRFAPYDTLSRQEGFTFLYRALGELGVSWAEGDITLLDSFSDGGSVADWARSAAATLIANGVVQGSGTGLNPTASLSRAEMAKMLDSVIS